MITTLRILIIYFRLLYFSITSHRYRDNKLLPVQKHQQARRPFSQDPGGTDPETKVLFLSTFGSSDEIVNTLNASNVGAPMKRTLNLELVAAIRTIKVSGSQTDRRPYLLHGAGGCRTSLDRSGLENILESIRILGELFAPCAERIEKTVVRF